MRTCRFSARAGKAKLVVRPVTPERWADLERLFGKNGACGGCWCMWWRLSRPEFEAGKGERNRGAMKRLVDSGAEPGLIAYFGEEPAGWCAVAPRKDYPRLQRSRTLRPIDNEPVWSVSCFFVAREYRRRSVSVELLKGAVGFVRKKGGRIVEGYPVIPAKGRMPDVFAWTGLVSAFHKAGFREAARPAPTRRIMRFVIA